MNPNLDRTAGGADWRPYGKLAALLLLLALPARALLAQDGESSLERLWDRAELFTGDSESIVRSIVLSGRFQVDQANVDSGDADFSDLDLRRMRFGVKMGLLDDFMVHAEAEFDPQGGHLGYQRLTDTYVAWSPSDALELTIGKHGVGFTMDGQTSSKELIAIDRSNLANNIWFTEEYVPGISVAGEKNKFVYNFGVFSSGSRNRGFGDSDGGEFVLATVGYDFGERLGAEEALLRVNWVDNDPDPANGFTRPLEQILSVNLSYDAGDWGVRADLSSATGYLGQSDLWGLMVMPFFDLNRNLQVVTRYTFLASDDPNGIRLGRYENQLVSGRGDEYSEAYLGVNYYWHGHKLKLQTGLQYADMDDSAADGGRYSGWALTTGFRISW